MKSALRRHSDIELTQEAAAEHDEERTHEIAVEPELNREAEFSQEAAAEIGLNQKAAVEHDEECAARAHRGRARPRGSRRAR